MRTAEIVLGLLVLASAVASFAGKLRIPAPSLLVLAGLAVGLLPGVPAVHVTPELVSLVVLPPLLYAAAVDVVITDLRVVLRPVAVLAVGLVVASAVAVAFVAHGLAPEITVQVGLVLGAVLASTDPVAVSALARSLRLPPRLLALVQGESLLNDATSLLLFRVVVAGVVAGHLAGPVTFSLRFLGLGVGGAAVGIVIAFLVRQLHERTDDVVIDGVISLIAPYAMFVAAEVAHTSGVTAVVFGGLYLGPRRFQMLRGPARLQIAHIYDVLVFLLESAVFAIIGLELPGLVRALPTNQHNFVLVALVVTATLLAARIVWVTGATFLPGLLEASDGQAVARRRSRVVAVTSWAGTRGVVPLAAALSIPVTTRAGLPFPHRDLLLVLAATSTATTLVVQGLTLGPVVRRAGLVRDPDLHGREEALARHAAVAAAVERLEEMHDLEAASPAAVDWLRREFRDRLERAEGILRAVEFSETDIEPAATAATRQEMRSLRRELIAVESARLHELVARGVISEAVRRKVQRMLDFEEARSSDDS
ncbi:MAG TPA: Na+/H+ antiporter [Mycobacteriales bacterium]|nr:Na+/H+ antiporter [Mycobacteriales bacterium]